MAKSRRSYKGAAAANTLKANIADNATSIELNTAMSGWSTGSEPFFVVIDPGTAKEEKMCVIYVDNTHLTVVDPAVTSSWSSDTAGRGVDDTTARSHDAGATIYPVFTAREANEANELVSKYAHQGAIVHQGASTFTELQIGTAGQVMKVNSGATAPEWGTVGSAGIADGSVTEDKLASSSVTSAKIADGTIVDADINASAAIALSKLATGALPTAITVASANIVDGTIVAGDIASNAVTTAKILDANVTTAKIADDAVTSDKIGAPTLTAKTDSFTLALADENCTMQCNKATVMTVTVPTSSVAFATGAVVTLMQYGAGQVTIQGDTGVNVRSANGLKLRTQYSMATLVKISNTEWVLSGDTVVS